MVPYTGTIKLFRVRETCSPSVLFDRGIPLEDVVFEDGKMIDGDYTYSGAFGGGTAVILGGKIAKIGTVGDCTSYRNTNGHAYRVISTDSDGRVTYKYFDWVDADTGFVWDGVVHTMHNN
jgi:hypothetical protein